MRSFCSSFQVTLGALKVSFLQMEIPAPYSRSLAQLLGDQNSVDGELQILIISSAEEAVILQDGSQLHLTFSYH